MIVVLYTVSYVYGARYYIESIWIQLPDAVGGWSGRERSDVCKELSGTGDSAFWIRNADECSDLLARKSQSIRVILDWVGGVGALVYCCRVLIEFVLDMCC